MDLIMFDLDGTLADTGPDLADSVNFTRAHFDLAPLGARRIYANVGRGVEHLIRNSLPIENADHFHEAMRVFLEYYEAHLLDKTVLYSGVRDLLEHFRGKRRVVVSNKVLRLSEAVLRGLGVGECFDLILGGDSAPEKKPHPALLALALERFQTAPSSALMVGDGDIDVEAGKRAGVLTCGVTYGLGDIGRLIAAKPDVLIETLPELSNYFY
ncbi:MAG: HAD family hydrolase [Candidatus Binatia bacterium]